MVFWILFLHVFAASASIGAAFPEGSGKMCGGLFAQISDLNASTIKRERENLTRFEERADKGMHVTDSRLRIHPEDLGSFEAIQKFMDRVQQVFVTHPNGDPTFWYWYFVRLALHARVESIETSIVFYTFKHAALAKIHDHFELRVGALASALERAEIILGRIIETPSPAAVRLYNNSVDVARKYHGHGGLPRPVREHLEIIVQRQDAIRSREEPNEWEEPHPASVDDSFEKSDIPDWPFVILSAWSVQQLIMHH